MRLKKSMTDYFSKHTADELKEKGEELIRDELTDLINSQLVLGKISSVYFKTYTFIN